MPFLIFPANSRREARESLPGNLVCPECLLAVAASDRIPVLMASSWALWERCKWKRGPGPYTDLSVPVAMEVVRGNLAA